MSIHWTMHIPYNNFVVSFCMIFGKETTILWLQIMKEDDASPAGYHANLREKVFYEKSSIPMKSTANAGLFLCRR